MMCQIDDEDLDKVRPYTWHAAVKGRHHKVIYATAFRKGVKPYSHVLMHRLIMDAKHGQLIDHKDNDGLNNCRSNLQFIDHTRNIRKKRPNGNSRSGFKGVAWNSKGECWHAKIYCNRKNLFLGVFRDPAEAARAYDAKALELFDQFAFLNFPLERKRNVIINSGSQGKLTAGESA